MGGLTKEWFQLLIREIFQVGPIRAVVKLLTSSVQVPRVFLVWRAIYHSQLFDNARLGYYVPHIRNDEWAKLWYYSLAFFPFSHCLPFQSSFSFRQSVVHQNSCDYIHGLLLLPTSSACTLAPRWFSAVAEWGSIGYQVYRNSISLLLIGYADNQPNGYDLSIDDKISNWGRD